MIDNNTTLSSEAMKPRESYSGSWSGQQPVRWNGATSTGSVRFPGEDTDLGTISQNVLVKGALGASL